MRRSGNGRLFQARGAATANERSPSDDVIRGPACDRARRGGSETCSDGRCGRRRDEVGQMLVLRRAGNGQQSCTASTQYTA